MIKCVTKNKQYFRKTMFQKLKKQGADASRPSKGFCIFLNSDRNIGFFCYALYILFFYDIMAAVTTTLNYKVCASKKDVHFPLQCQRFEDISLLTVCIDSLFISHCQRSFCYGVFEFTFLFVEISSTFSGQLSLKHCLAVIITMIITIITKAKGGSLLIDPDVSFISQKSPSSTYIIHSLQ